MNILCIKFNSGDTVFAELVSTSNTNITVMHPLLTKSVSIDGEKEGIVLTPWMPFTDEITFKFSSDSIIYMGSLSSNFIHFYGSSRIKDEVAHINARGVSRVENGESRVEVTKDVIEEVRNLCDLYALKYGLDAESCKESFSLPEAEEITLH